MMRTALPSTNIKSVFSKYQRHPTPDISGKHTLREYGQEGLPFRGDNRHAECADCHNPHVIGAWIKPAPAWLPPAYAPMVHPDYDDDPTQRNENGNLIYDETFGSGVFQGVWGVEPVWPDTKWERPMSFTETLPANGYPDYAEKEYQICFKCHSYYADQGVDSTASTKVARDFNPKNASSHPVVSQSLSMLPSRLREPWKSGSRARMYCSDCHGNDAEGENDPVGVHGSNKANMLRSFRETGHHTWGMGTLASLAGDPAARDNHFCFACHPIFDDPNWVHSTSYHTSYPCTGCHKQNIHGWKKMRFLKVTLDPSWNDNFNIVCYGDVCGVNHYDVFH